MLRPSVATPLLLCCSLALAQAQPEGDTSPAEEPAKQAGGEGGSSPQGDAGLGALLANSTVVTDDMVSAASQAVANAMTEQELADGMLYPEINRLRDVSTQVARAVAGKAIDDGYANATKQDVDRRLENDLWRPDYPEMTSE